MNEHEIRPLVLACEILSSLPDDSEGHECSRFPQQHPFCAFSCAFSLSAAATPRETPPASNLRGAEHILISLQRCIFLYSLEAAISDAMAAVIAPRFV